jgi:hypothetical protein
VPRKASTPPQCEGIEQQGLDPVLGTRAEPAAYSESGKDRCDQRLCAIGLKV